MKTKIQAIDIAQLLQSKELFVSTNDRKRIYAERPLPLSEIEAYSIGFLRMVGGRAGQFVQEG